MSFFSSSLQPSGSGTQTTTQRPSFFGGSMAASQPSQQGHQLPALSQSQAQLSSSLWQPLQASPHQKPVVEQMRLVTEKWDPANPNCAFKHYFYNKVDATTVPLYKPQPSENQREWEDALLRKPGDTFMPVLCSGFEGLGQRLGAQKRATAEFNTRLHQINATLDLISSRHELETEVRAVAARRRHVNTSERCLALASKIQVLRNRGFAMSSDEDDLRGRLAALERTVQDPAVSAREEEMWSRLITFKGYAEQLTGDKPTTSDGEVLDEELEQKAKKILEDYEVQLKHIKKEVDTMIEAHKAWEEANSKSGAI